MTFQPEKIKKDHVLSAIQVIKEHKIELKPSTGYDVLIDGENYPPKEVMRYAHEQMNGEKIWEKEGGEPTNSYLRELGFKVYEKERNKYLYELKEEFLETWPLSRVKEMELHEYTNLDKASSFCYWVEFKTSDLGGIGGGSSFKFGIYKRKNTDSSLSSKKYETDGVYAWYAKLGDTAEYAFKEVKESILEIIRATQDEQLEKINDIDFSNTVKWKIAFLYSDYKIFNFFDREGLEFLAKKQGGGNPKEMNTAKLNQFILSNKPLSEDFYDYAKDLWDSWDQRDEDSEESEEDVEFHEIKNRFSEEDLETYFGFLKEFINRLDLKRGDRRIVLGCKRNRLNFMIGQRYCWNMFPKYKGGKFGVISMEPLNENSDAYEGNSPQPYYTYSHQFSPSSEDMQSILEGMRFELNRTNKSGLLKYHNKEFEDYIFSDHADSSIKKLKNPYLNQNLNTILYGPPGTGKTYHASDLAVQIIEPDAYKEDDHSHNKYRFDELVKKGRIVFTTFHQSTSYEDFIEGIKPVMADDKEKEDKGNIQYKIESGVFKKLIEKIEDRKKLKKQDAPSFQISEEKFNQPVNKVSLGDSTLEEDEAIYEYCIKNDCIAIGFGEDIDFTGVQDTTDIRERYKKAGIEVESANDYNVYAIQRLILWMKPGQLVMVSNGNKKLRAIGEVSGDYYFDKDTSIRYSQFRKVKWLYPDIDIPIKEVYPKQFSQQTIYQMDGNAFDRDFFKNEKKSIAPDEEKSL